jgi:hypothetical protein
MAEGGRETEHAPPVARSNDPELLHGIGRSARGEPQSALLSPDRCRARKGASRAR